MENLIIDTELARDYDMSGINFNENFEILRYSGYRESSISIYTDFSNLSSNFSLSDYFKIIDNKYNRVMLIKYLVDADYCYYSEIKNSNNLFFELLEFLGYSDSDYNFINEIDSLLDDLAITYISNYLLMSVIGYSQGDYAEILVNTAEFKEVSGAEFKEEDYQEYFTNLFYNAPIYGDIKISFDYEYKKVCIETGETFIIPATYNEILNYSEWCNNEYEIELNIDQIIGYIQGRTLTTLTDEDKKRISDKLKLIDYSDIAA